MVHRDKKFDSTGWEPLYCRAKNPSLLWFIPNITGVRKKHHKLPRYIFNISSDGLLKYRNDGRYTIDNMPAERAIRTFTVNRNNTKFFSSEEGVKVAATLFTIVETARQYGVNVRDYLMNGLREVMNGNKDYSTYTLQAYVTK